MSNVNEVVVSYLAAWNERDEERRRKLVAKTWTEEGSYMDAHRRGVGHAGIDAMIDPASAISMAPARHQSGQTLCIWPSSRVRTRR